MAENVCPWWMGYLLASPIRKMYHNPNRICDNYVQPGMKVLDYGCAMGFFTLPLAEMVGSNGKVIGVDIQQKMIDRLEKRARQAGYNGQLESRLCSADNTRLDDLANQIDFALAFHVVHEVSSQQKVIDQLAATLKPGGRLLFSEPRGHCSEELFQISLTLFEEAGLQHVSEPAIKGSRSVLLVKPARGA